MEGTKKEGKSFGTMMIPYGIFYGKQHLIDMSHTTFHTIQTGVQEKLKNILLRKEEVSFIFKARISMIKT